MKRGSIANRLLDRYIGIPILYSSSLLARRRKYPHRPQRIGLMASPTLGDTLINSVAVQDVRNHYPNAHIIYIASKTNSAAAKLLPCVDEIVYVSITDPLRSIRVLRRSRLDILIDFTSWQRITAFYTASSGAKYRVGFRTPNQYRHWHYDLCVDHSSAVHEVENFRNLLRALGLKPSASPKVNLPECQVLQLEPCARRIVFHPWATGDRHALREWSAAKWVELAQAFNHSGTQFVVTGAPSQLARSKSLCESLQRADINAVPFVSPDGLASLGAMLLKADLVISVNTGIMHLSAILGAPTIALNGPNSSHRWGPLGPRAAAVDPHGGGGGFLHLGFEFPGNPTDTMERTRVEDVVRTAYQLVPELAPKTLAHAH